MISVFDNESLSWSFRLNNKLTLPGKIEWQTRMNYRGPEETAITKREGSFSIDLAFSKELFDDKASLTFNIRDLLDQTVGKSKLLIKPSIMIVNTDGDKDHIP